MVNSRLKQDSLESEIVDSDRLIADAIAQSSVAFSYRSIWQRILAAIQKGESVSDLGTAET